MGGRFKKEFRLVLRSLYRIGVLGYLISHIWVDLPLFSRKYIFIIIFYILHCTYLILGEKFRWHKFFYIFDEFVFLWFSFYTFTSFFSILCLKHTTIVFFVNWTIYNWYLFDLMGLMEDFYVKINYIVFCLIVFVYSPILYVRTSYGKNAMLLFSSILNLFGLYALIKLIPIFHLIIFLAICACNLSTLFLLYFD